MFVFNDTYETTPLGQIVGLLDTQLSLAERMHVTICKELKWKN